MPCYYCYYTTTILFMKCTSSSAYVRQEKQGIDVIVWQDTGINPQTPTCGILQNQCSAAS